LIQVIFSYNGFKSYKNNFSIPQISRKSYKKVANNIKLSQLLKLKMVKLRFISIFTAVQCRKKSGPKL